MSGVRRRIALLSGALICRLTPAAYQDWADAIFAELAAIPDDGEALRFASGVLFGLGRRLLVRMVLRLCRAIAGTERDCDGREAGDMRFRGTWQATPRIIGVISASGATLLGLLFMALAGAPTGYLAINFGALVIGLLMMANLQHGFETSRRWQGVVVLAGGIALAATAQFGVEVEGAVRWIRVGPLALQPSLILLPMMMVSFARAPGIAATGGMGLAAVALACQPDRAMAGALAAGMLTLFACRREPGPLLILLASAGGFVTTLLQPDTGQAVPFVDQIVFRSFGVNWLAGCAVLSGLALLLIPAVAGLRMNDDVRTAALVFGAGWAAVIAAAALGNYPTPLVGYGGGAVLGYVLSLALLPKVGNTRQDGIDEASRGAADAGCIGPHYRLGVA